MSELIKPLRFLSLFAGIGGFDLGLERAEWQCVGQVEVDSFCQKVLAKHWPNVWRWDDVRTVTGELIREHCGSVDAIVGGFPCQPHSLAGEQKAHLDERDLWPEYLRLVREIKPRIIVGENVAGLLSSDGGRFFGGILRDLAACGYDAEWNCFPAASIGSPHSRDRVWIAAYPIGTGLQRFIFSGESLRGPAQKTSAQFGNRVISCGIHWAKDSPNLLLGNGVSARMARPVIKAYGNAVVPQVAEVVGRAIMESPNV